MPLKLVAAVFMGLAILASAAPAGAAEPPVKGCPAGFNLGAMTFEELLRLPKLQAALADGVTTIEHVEAVHAFVDTNGTHQSPGRALQSTKGWGASGGHE